MTDMEQMLSALDKMSERQSENLREMRLQTIHQEHIARQSENVTLMLTVITRLIAPTEEARVLLESMVKDFKRESMQWREHVEQLTSDDECADLKHASRVATHDNRSQRTKRG